MPRPTPRLRKQSLRTEIDAAWLYGRVADHEADPDIARLFGEMARGLLSASARYRRHRRRHRHDGVNDALGSDWEW